MKTSSPPHTAVCERFQTKVGMPARWALDCKKKELIGDYRRA